jgi:hypothetical protein
MKNLQGTGGFPMTDEIFFSHAKVWCVEFAMTAVVYFPPLDFTS